METYYPFLAVLVVFILVSFLIRKDVNEDKSLTKKGFIKVIVSMVVVAILAAVYVTIATH
ncbi:DUF3976 domain-containing protein [Heyndrickxia oleronia]|uniref:DUF3976 domain-containing protein n=1 Tax=Heyndrickxia oleronia TaxID=38875 RepID=A0AAW6T2D6_9BACI|nr:DUF3976 domain-containing protein [Heyndrickxia oleronia]NYV66479.1 DUF3976 domain-containing protein [Bacillus sp. Gen3]MCM3240755.1 DUF3976 domain-containing protein [Heyndrickxia oleronia]MCM3454806.1 DUF3976 domain-containing protein [Heyndrickxia oleronia]MDH5164480.1 DUF3976 domain-containing protein [Heyndrickxia oleronia]GIN41472.1 hypothetical protein J19TS1_44210 [Heyndrickxia oleronia]